MTFWKPGKPAPAPTDPWDFDCDAEKHKALPVFNPRASLPVQQQRSRLPINRYRMSFLHALEEHRAIVLCGPTGCGKSTQLPQYMDEAGWSSKGYAIAITLPRRLAAVTIATRVAEEMGVELGREVGYKIRFDHCVTPGETRLEFMTEGVLIREMLSDPLLTRYSVVMVDEAHERSVQTDLLLGLLKKIMKKRPRLRIIVASATVDVSSFLRFFQRRKKEGASALPPPKRRRVRSGWDDQSGETLKQRTEDGEWRKLVMDLADGGSGAVPERDVCVLMLEGRVHEVKMHYLEEPAADYVETAVSTVMSIHERLPDGDILVFLTGQEEIEAVCALIRERWHQAKERAEIPAQRPKPLHTVPLYGALPKEAQMRAFLPAPRGGRKVVVSTNLAEASVTLDGVVYVVDACLVKIDTFCPYNGVSYLNIAACSKSSARQRAGRAGRTRPGHCYRLLTEAAFHSTVLPSFTLPEVARSDLKDTILLMKCLGIDDIAAFDFVTQPSREAIELALEELFALGAIDAEAHIVEPLGVRMAHGPLPVTLMRLLLLAAEPPHSCTAEAAIICAMLTLQSPWLQTSNQDRLHSCKQSFAVYEGDLVSQLNVFRQHEVYREQDTEWAKRHMLNTRILDRAAMVRRQLLLYLQRFELPIESCDFDVMRIQRLACAALFLNAARRLPNGMYRLCRPLDEVRAPHTRFNLHSNSVLAIADSQAPADFVVFAEAHGSGNQASLVHNTRIMPEWLSESAPHYFRQVGAGFAAPD